MAITGSSKPPTISKVGAVTRSRTSIARSGRPPRETTAEMSSALLGRRMECCRSTGAGAEQADGQVLQTCIAAHRIDGFRHPPGQQRDVKHIAPIRSLSLGQQVEQERGETVPIESGRHQSIARTEAARSAPMREDDNTRCLIRHLHVCFEPVDTQFSPLRLRATGQHCDDVMLEPLWRRQRRSIDFDQLPACPGLPLPRTSQNRVRPCATRDRRDGAGAPRCACRGLRRAHSLQCQAQAWPDFRLRRRSNADHH